MIESRRPLVFVVLFALVVALGVAAGGRAAAQVLPVGDPAAAPRPRVALVLSGGGARGFAHVGVLKALEQMRVPIDLVVGTSMGAAVGGAYAAGVPPEALERFVLETDWSALLADRPPRAEQPIRRRIDDLDVPSRVELGLGPDGLVPPAAAAGSQALEAALRTLLPARAGDRPARAQPIPFAAVATDLRTGARVELADAPLFVAIRASLSVPGLFPPFRHEGRPLVDGGLVSNLPVALARSLGADVVVAVNVGTPIADASKVGDALGITQQMLNILTERNVRRSLRELGPRDVLVEPSLGDASFVDFRAGRRAIEAGERAALALAERLASVALTPEAYAARARELGSARDAPAVVGVRPIASVRVVGTRYADPDTLARLSGLVPGDAVSREEVNRAADRLYARGEFERVEARVADGPDGLAVTLGATEPPGQRSRLRFGLQVGTDFRDDQEVSVAALHVMPWLNDWGGELRTLLRAGSTTRAAIDWWQPLGAGSPWFGIASARYGARTETIYAMDRPAFQAGFGETGAGLAIGRRIGDLGQVSVGVARLFWRNRLALPDPPDSPTDEGVQTVGTVALLLDTLDSVAFPERGTLLSAQLEWPLRRAAGPEDGQRGIVRVRAMQAFRAGPVSGHVYGEYERSRAEWASPTPLGGFLRLSGAPRNTLYADGESVLFARVVAGIPIGAMPVGLGGAIRAGLSLEGANGYADRNESFLSLGAIRFASSVFASIDTRFGPLHLAAGKTQGLRPSLYLMLGPYW